MLATAVIFTFVLRTKIQSSFSSLLPLHPIFPTVSGLWWPPEGQKREPTSLMLGSEANSLSTQPTHKVNIYHFLQISFLYKKPALKHIICYHAETYPNINSVWTAFENTLIAGSGIISYAPVFTDYFYQGLKEFYDDNVQYMEIRTTLPEVLVITCFFSPSVCSRSWFISSTGL